MQLGDFNHAILMPQSPKRYPCQDTPGHSRTLVCTATSASEHSQRCQGSLKLLLAALCFTPLHCKQKLTDFSL